MIKFPLRSFIYCFFSFISLALLVIFRFFKFISKWIMMALEITDQMQFDGLLNSQTPDFQHIQHTLTVPHLLHTIAALVLLQVSYNNRLSQFSLAWIQIHIICYLWCHLAPPVNSRTWSDMERFDPKIVETSLFRSSRPPRMFLF